MYVWCMQERVDEWRMSGGGEGKGGEKLRERERERERDIPSFLDSNETDRRGEERNGDTEER